MQPKFPLAWIARVLGESPLRPTLAAIALATGMMLCQRVVFGQTPQVPSRTESQPASPLPPQPSAASAETHGKERQAADSQSASANGDRADDESPALGVVVGPCPARAVCVMGTRPHSPAEEAGIEPGDYILSIDGKEVASPGELKKVISILRPEAEVTLRIWRQGEERETKIQLASKAEQLPRSHDAWLGVMLSPSEPEGIKIDHIVPGSPAGHSDLREGDILIRIQGETIASVEDFIRHIEELGPGDKLTLTIRRGSEVRTINLDLGSMDDAPMSFLRRLHAMRGAPFSVAPHDFSSMDFTDRALDDIRQQIRELRNEIRELRGAAPGDHSKPEGTKEGEASQRESALLDHKPISEFPMRLPSGRAHNREPESKRGYPYGFYGPAPYWQYGSGYRIPDSSYGNSYYYRFAGRPYYYFRGNSNWNRYQPGASIQLGPKLGVYWY